ncbi:MAG: type III pantothenate kinase [Alphaproteobacteria bacterium]|jgi:type III pantothenate kinase
MLLAIDAGNTNTVFAVYDGEEQRGLWRAATDTRRTADEHFVWLAQLMEVGGMRRNDIKAAIISTVVPASLFNLTRLCQRYFDVEAIVVGDPGVDLGIAVNMDNPAEVGADRLVNAVAAKTQYGGPLILIDFGTATTFDVIDSDGDYTGGIIAPGANLSMEALHMAAAKLPLVAVRQPQHVVGRSTVEAMQSGIFFGYLSLIEGLVGRIRAERSDPSMRAVATGGLAPLFFGATDAIHAVDRDLTLRGLLEIYERNAN